MTAEEQTYATEHFPIWLAATYPGETDVSPEVIEHRRAEYWAELERLLAVGV